MAQQVSAGVLSVEGIIQTLTALVTSGGELFGAMIHLYQSSFGPTPDSTAADFAAAEASFTGYAALALTWSAVGIDDAGNPTSLSDRAFFQATDAVSPNTIGGCWIEHDVTGPPATETSVMYFQLANPIPMNVALDFIGCVVGAQLPNGAGYAIFDN